MSQVPYCRLTICTQRPPSAVGTIRVLSRLTKFLSLQALKTSLLLELQVEEVRETLETYDRLQVWSLDRTDPAAPCINPLGEVERQESTAQPQSVQVGA